MAKPITNNSNIQKEFLKLSIKTLSLLPLDLGSRCSKPNLKPQAETIINKESSITP